MDLLIGPSSADLSTCDLHASLLVKLLSWRELNATMSALLETSLGDIVIDLLVDDSPRACEKYVAESLTRSSVLPLTWSCPLQLPEAVQTQVLQFRPRA